MTSQWIGPDPQLQTGDVGFLLHHVNGNTGSERHELRFVPAHTNQSREPRLNGWCGSYNNVSTSACGLWRVERVARNGRAFVRELEGDELRAGLDALGYPELMPAATSA